MDALGVRPVSARTVWEPFGVAADRVGVGRGQAAAQAGEDFAEPFG